MSLPGPQRFGAGWRDRWGGEGEDGGPVMRAWAAGGLMEWPRLRESESEDETALPHASPRQMLDTRAAMQEQGVDLLAT
mgnify:CR=1 FL=1